MLLAGKLKFKILPINLLDYAAFFLKVFLVIFPWQIQTLIFKNTLLTGQFNPFVSVFLSLGEVVLWAAIFCYSCYLISGGKIKIMLINLQESALILYLLAGVISVFWASDRVFSWLLLLREIELIGLYILISSRVIAKKEILKYLFIGGVIQALIGFIQYVKQGSIGLNFLGEADLAASVFNVAKINLAGEKLIRAYGTFPHANVFGGYMVFLLGLIFVDLNKENFSKKIFLMIIFAVALLISFSRTAWLAGLGFMIILLAQQSIKINLKYLFLGLFLLICLLILFNLHVVILSRIMDFSGNSYSERALFAEIGQKIILANPAGTGLGNFVIEMGQYSKNLLQPWLFQPVHNIFLLAFAELGIAGGIVLIMLFISSIKMCFSAMKRLLKSEKYQWKVWLAILFMLIIIGMFDHYLYSIWSGQVILFLLLALINLAWQERQELALIK